MDRSQYLHPDKELMSRQEIEELQLKRLQETVRHCMNSPFYKKRFEEEDLTPDDIKSLDDLNKTRPTRYISIRNSIRTS